MSFLAELQVKKTKLKSTSTLVTYADGTQTIETPSGNNTVLVKKPFGFIVDTKPDTIAACILENFLYLGSQDAVNSQNIKVYGITHVLSIGVEMPKFCDDFSLAKMRNLFVPCLDIPDGNNLLQIMAKCIEFIQEAQDCNGVVLVHCNAGVSRSVSIVIAYLIQVKKFAFTTAYELVKSKRECIKPNAGFIEILRNL